LTEYLTEQEQIQQLKTWVKQYGPTVLLGIAAALVITFCWRYWQAHELAFSQRASIAYDSLLNLRTDNKNSDTVLGAKSIVKDYAKTPYADMATLMLARDAVLKKEYPAAISTLNNLINHSDSPPIREIARIRIARILIDENKIKDALAVLNKIDDPSFIGLINEVRGDAFLAINNQEAAKKAYQLALKQIPNAETLRPILEMKLNQENTIKT